MLNSAQMTEAFDFGAELSYQTSFDCLLFLPTEKTNTGLDLLQPGGICSP